MTEKKYDSADEILLELLETRRAQEKLLYEEVVSAVNCKVWTSGQEGGSVFYSTILNCDIKCKSDAFDLLEKISEETEKLIKILRRRMSAKLIIRNYPNNNSRKPTGENSHE